MQKALLQLLTIATIFFALWFTLSKINWRKHLHINQVSKSTEEKLGDLIWENISDKETEIKLLSITKSIDTLLQTLCKANKIEYEKFKVHIIQKDEINAFALPNNHLVIYTGLINNCENEAELLGVLGHEIAHIEKKHITKKLLKEIGLTAIISITGKDNSVVKKAIEILTSSSYDRTLEKEADITSVDYLLKTEINPEPFANFLYKMSNNETNIPKQLYWISTHPESKERAEDIIAYIKDKTIKTKNILYQSKWEQLKNTINNIDEE